MKKRLIKLMALGVGLLLTCSSSMVVSAKGMEYTNSFSLSAKKAITIDGDFSDWADIPYSYEYNWDNSENCWQWGVWIGEECYKTPRGSYSTDVRHLMQMYCDGENVYLHIIFSRDYGTRINGNDYHFYVDGQDVSFILVAEDGTGLETLLQKPAGTYPFDVRHANSGLSFKKAQGSYAYAKLTEDKVNDEIEIYIPLSEMKRQNENIKIETIGSVELFNPNLMYRRIKVVGTSSGPIVLAVVCSGVAVGGFFLLRKKKYGHL